MTMADRIGVMSQGRLAQVGTAAEIYEQPATRWVAEFIGDVNLLDGVVAEASDGLATVTTGAGPLRAASTGRLSAGQRVTVAIRPEKFRISSASPADAARNCLAGEVTDIAYLGDMSLYKVRLDSGDMVKAASVNVTRLLERPIGWNERVWLTVAPDGAVVLTN